MYKRLENERLKSILRHEFRIHSLGFFFSAGKSSDETEEPENNESSKKDETKPAQQEQ